MWNIRSFWIAPWALTDMFPVIFVELQMDHCAQRWSGIDPNQLFSSRVHSNQPNDQLFFFFSKIKSIESKASVLPTPPCRCGSCSQMFRPGVFLQRASLEKKERKKRKPGVCERLKILKLEVSEADSRVASFNPRLFLLFHKEKNSRSRQREVSNLLSIPPCQESITQRSPA